MTFVPSIMSLDTQFPCILWVPVFIENIFCQILVISHAPVLTVFQNFYSLVTDSYGNFNFPPKRLLGVWCLPFFAYCCLSLFVFFLTTTLHLLFFIMELIRCPFMNRDGTSRFKYFLWVESFFPLDICWRVIPLFYSPLYFQYSSIIEITPWQGTINSSIYFKK